MCDTSATKGCRARFSQGEMLHSRDVPIGESALLVIDAQESFKVGARWAKRSNPDFEKNVGRLVALFRRHDLPVVYFLHSDVDPGFSRDDEHYRLMDFLEPADGEPVFHKRSRNVFTGTALSELLLEKGVRRVLVTGISMEQCCETSARVAADLGYAVDFVTDATMTFPIANPERPGEELGVDAIRERTEYALRGRFAAIATAEGIVRQLEGGP